MNKAALQNAVRRVAAAGAIPRLLPVLAASAAQTSIVVRKAVLAEVTAFSATGNPDILPGFDQHAHALLNDIMRIFSGDAIGDFAFITSHAHRLAEHRFPLEATLHADRIVQRMVAQWLHQAVSESGLAHPELAFPSVADFAVDYVGFASSITTAEYVAHTRTLAEVEGDRRTELLNILLSGYDESDGRVAQVLKRAGYLEQRQAYCVVVAQSTNAAEMENPARAQRITAAIVDVLGGTSIRTLTGVRSNLVTAVLSDRRRQSGWTAPQSGLAERIRPLLLAMGPAVLVGTSVDHPSTSFIPKALHEAVIALDFATVVQRVVQFQDLPIRDLLVHRGHDHVQSAAPHWVSALIAANARANGSLVHTLRAVADADMNVQKAARSIEMHPNTVYARLERIKDVTGLDGQRYKDLTELLLAADCWKV